jgi:hypothetical protein
MTEAEWHDLLILQSGRCAICADPMTDPQTDHDHAVGTGTVRGLLCRSCNLALGLLRDSKSAIAAASTYLASQHQS